MNTLAQQQINADGAITSRNNSLFAGILVMIAIVLLATFSTNALTSDREARSGLTSNPTKASAVQVQANFVK